MVQEISFEIASLIRFAYRDEIERTDSRGICLQVGFFIANEGVGIVRPSLFLSDRLSFDLDNNTLKTYILSSHLCPVEREIDDVSDVLSNPNDALLLSGCFADEVESRAGQVLQRYRHIWVICTLSRRRVAAARQVVRP